VRRKKGRPRIAVSFWIPPLLSAALAVSACRPRIQPVPAPKLPDSRGFSIQAGVFAQEANARGLTLSLQSRSLEADYFPAGSGCFKVWIGRYGSRPEAAKAAEHLLESGAIREFFIVDRRALGLPAAAPEISANRMRRDLVETARSFIDYPYAWGGASAQEGFDCSGLAMTVYRLNGIEMPRSLYAQFEAGRNVSVDRLEAGDLLFFSMSGGGRLSHVGIYIGDGLFIHAPGMNKTIRTDSLSNPYFQTRLSGARRYVGDF
jgi:hypothetical protein